MITLDDFILCAFVTSLRLRLVSPPPGNYHSVLNKTLMKAIHHNTMSGEGRQSEYIKVLILKAGFDKIFSCLQTKFSYPRLPTKAIMILL